MSAFLKNLPVKVLGGSRQVFICLRPPIPSPPVALLHITLKFWILVAIIYLQLFSRPFPLSPEPVCLHRRGSAPKNHKASVFFTMYENKKCQGAYKTS